MKSKNQQRTHFFLSPTDLEEISKIVNSFKSKKSYGHYNTSTAFVKRAIIALKVPLSILINISVSNGYVTDLKIAKIIPMHKNKNPEIYTNYRFTSLLPSISKILEKAVHKRLHNYISSLYG